ncbi:MAG: hypothetical protein QF662_06215, partial [Phycisphaerae bacterium]|nr:hypothetical protein [Phycisphaerae bacterium]
INRYEVESGKIMYWHSALEEQLQMEKYLDALLKRLGVKRPARVVSSRLANPGEADWDFSLVFTGGPTYEQYRERTES